MRIDFHPAATKELEQSADWCGKHSEVACRRFLVAIDKTIEKIAAAPERFVRVDAGTVPVA